jgi:phosphoglycolate phosphatase
MIHHISGTDRIYDTVFIDFDGTIADTCEGIVKAVHHMFTCIGMVENDESELLKFIGPPVLHHLTDYYGFSEQKASDAYAHFREYYCETGLFQSRLYPGIEDAIRCIKALGKTLCVATSKPDIMARTLIEKFNLIQYFDGIYCADHKNGIYNKTQVLQNAFKHLGHTPQNAVMVGDRYHDIEGAKSVGIDSIGVLYGYGDYDELTKAGSDYLVDTTCDLVQLLGGKKQ